MTASESLAVGVLQLDGQNGERRERIGRARDAVRLAAEQIAAADTAYGILVLPELWPTGFFHFDAYESGAEALDGPVVAALLAEAREARIWIVGGSLVERSTAGLHNTTVVADDSGELVATYRKIHLFGHESREAQLLRAGSGPCIVESPFGRIGLMTCYDLRFPELTRDLATQGATMIVIVSAWPAARIEHWRTLLRARAIENQLWVVAANAVGDDAGVHVGGHSTVIAPDGEVLAEAGGDSESTLIEEIDLERVSSVRDLLPFVGDNRYTVELRSTT